VDGQTERCSLIPMLMAIGGMDKNELIKNCIEHNYYFTSAAVAVDSSHITVIIHFME